MFSKLNATDKAIIKVKKHPIKAPDGFSLLEVRSKKISKRLLIAIKQIVRMNTVKNPLAIAMNKNGKATKFKTTW